MRCAQKELAALEEIDSGHDKVFGALTSTHNLSLAQVAPRPALTVKQPPLVRAGSHLRGAVLTTPGPTAAPASLVFFTL